MIPKIIFSSLMAILLLSDISSAQTANVRLTFSEAISPSGVPTGTVTFTGLEGPELQVFEAQIAARTEAGCFASRDFSTARAVSPERANVSYDSGTGSYKLQWTGVRDKRDSCRVLLVGQSVASTDLAVWQSNYGVGGLREDDPVIPDNATYGRATYQLRLSPSSTSSSLSVKSPGKDGEVIEAAFPAPANSNFRLFEASFPSRSEAECIANQDFSAATPVGSDRGTISFDPASGVWFLKNANTSAPTEPCRALLADGDGVVDAGDYAVWRTAFGSTLFAEIDESLLEDAGGLDQDARTPGTATVTFTYVVTNTSPAVLR